MAKDPDILVDLTTASNDFEAQVIVQALEAQGIPARAFTTASSMLQWQIAPVHGFRISVRRRDLEAARSALRAIRADSVDLDWDEVDTGDRTPARPDEHSSQVPSCPRCHAELPGGIRFTTCPSCGQDLRDRPRSIPAVLLGWLFLSLLVAALFLYAFFRYF